MQFYAIKCEHSLFNEEESTEKKYVRHGALERETGIELSHLTEQFNERLGKDGYLFLSYISSGMAEFGLLIKNKANAKMLFDTFVKMSKYTFINTFVKEITFNSIEKLLSKAERFDLIDNREVLEKFVNITDADYIIHSLDYIYEENILETSEKEKIYEGVPDTFAQNTLKSEVDRIYSSKSDKFYGHPVNYYIETDNSEIGDKIVNILLSSLYDNNRIQNKRFGHITIDIDSRVRENVYEDIAKIQDGGTIIWDFADDDNEDYMANGREYVIENICLCIKKNCDRVLNIIRLPRNCEKIKRKLNDYLGGMTFVEITEDYMYRDEAAKYLKNRASRKKVRSDKQLVSKLEDKKGYLSEQLDTIFYEWYNKKLKTTVFPQYKDFDSIKGVDLASKPKGLAIEELDKMIGINEAKEVIYSANDYYKAQKLFREKGLVTSTPTMHMVFTGNPGTAKTTVARLVARIFKENDIIKTGRLVECGRGDLVGKYVGWTAPNIKKKFREAEGGVLFIDEAYSLVDDRDGMYGDEAINTIVQEMENHRNDVIVIFAGYPDKMEHFLDKNPGLRSRIAFHVKFNNYSTEELCDIAKLMASQMDMHITDEAMDKLRDVFEDARAQDDYGNGRFVRNMLERARMTQASRIVKMNYDSIKKSDLENIMPEDIKVPEVSKKERKRVIGF